MKKIIIGILILCTILMFAACSNHECALCGKKGADEKIEYYGEVLWICDDCEDNIDDLDDMLDDLTK